MISEDDKNKVRDATDLVALVSETVELRPRGNTDLWGCCPFHGEKTPSFHVIPATQVWHCFGCGEGGDAFTYVMKREGLSFPESIRYLADRAGIELEEDQSFKRSGTKRNRLVEVCEETCSFYHTLLMRGKAATIARSASSMRRPVASTASVSRRATACSSAILDPRASRLRK